MPPVTCETCGKSFPTASRFHAHQRRKTPCGPSRSVKDPAPLLKWVGGKSHIRDTVLQHFPSEIENYYEPFLGGGSILLALLHAKQQGSIRVKGVVHASDVNPSLVGFYRAVQRAPDVLLSHLRPLLAECPPYHEKAPVGVNRKPSSREEAMACTETYYYWIRARFNALSVEEKQTPYGAALFLFLNKTCFRGVYREGPHGFNVPFGNYKNPSIVDEAHLLAVSALLQPVVFHTRSFVDLSPSDLHPGDFLYLDPPYAPEKDTSFVGYVANGFDQDAHDMLFRWCHELRRNGIPLLMSNADVPLVREAFSSEEWAIHPLLCRRSIHCKTPDATAKEVLIRS